MSMALSAPAQRGAIELHGDGQVGRALRARLAADGIGLAALHTRSRSEVFSAVPAGVVVDATSPAYSGPAADRWVDWLEGTLAGGRSVATCNKAPLALAWARLERAAREGGAVLACSATVGAGTPVVATLRRLQAVHGIERVEASLSGTLAFVLGEVAAGRSLQEAVGHAQACGYTEPDPSIDLDGTDLAAKATILHNVLFPVPRDLDSDRTPLHIDAGQVRALARDGLHPQAVACIGRDGIRLGVVGRAPGLLQASGESRTAVDVRAFHPDGSCTLLAGPGAGPHATAAALAADLRALHDGRLPAGVWP
ncbi:MAG TPA: hypothetical protein VM286_00060 [Candidatus Thermoplasmatota archaeon]|nr:hypothetical protein [Candidatus Thermoplasmatota archaeon]